MMRKNLLLAASAIVAVILFAIPLLSKLRRVETGLCADTGTVLNSDQLRKNIISNLARNKQDIVRHQDIDYLPGTFRFEVVDNISDDNIARAVYSLKNGSDLFKAEFKFRNTELGQDFLKEPFVFLTYESGGNLNNVANRTASRDIRRIEGTKEVLGDFKPSLSQRLEGFGNHYFQIISRSFMYDCCTPKGSKKLPHGKSISIAYQEGMEKGRVISTESKSKIAIVSNCGDILTHKDESGFRRITWTYGN